MSGTISIIFDGEEKKIATGIKLRSLLTPEEIEQVLRGELTIVDARGQERGLGGALLDGMVLLRRPGPRARC
jgi:hypothetical protein